MARWCAIYDKGPYQWTLIQWWTIDCVLYIDAALPAFSLIVKGLIYIKFDKDQVPKGSYLWRKYMRRDVPCNNVTTAKVVQTESQSPRTLRLTIANAFGSVGNKNNTNQRLRDGALNLEVFKKITILETYRTSEKKE